MNNFWKIIIASVLSIYLLLLILFTCVYHEYQNIFIKDNNNKSDVILLYGTQNSEQLYKKAKELQNKYSSKKIIISPFVVNESLDSAILVKKNTMNPKNIVPDFESTSIETTSKFAQQYFKNNQTHDVLVVANDYEMKRLLRKLNKNSGVEYYPVSVVNNRNSKEYHLQREKEAWKLILDKLNL